MATGYYLCFMDDDIRCSPFLDELKRPFNAVVLLLGLAFIFDLYHGSPMARQLALLQFNLMHVDIAHKDFRIVTFFGIFPSVDAYARKLDKSLGILFLAFAGFWYGRGALRSLLSR